MPEYLEVILRVAAVLVIHVLLAIGVYFFLRHYWLRKEEEESWKPPAPGAKPEEPTQKIEGSG